MQIIIRSRFDVAIFKCNADSIREAVELAVKKDVNLSYAYLAGVDLENADLRNAKLNFANFDNSNLTNAQLEGSSLNQAKFNRTRLTYRQLELAKTVDAIDLSTAIFSDSRWRNMEETHEYQNRKAG